ncbi:MAG: thioesterase family protein [Bacteroidales bacterium]|jgi:predicted thioesterase|nr:thioesterase family protein [Bacteroidales bacterium]
MKLDIQPGLTFEAQMTVTTKDSARSYGSGLLEVFATPAMISFMEQCSMLCIAGLLPENWGSVGTEIHIQHVRASLIGAHIYCKATVKKVDGRKIIFSVEALEDDQIIGFGSHTRFIVNNQKFMDKLLNP